MNEDQQLSMRQQWRLEQERRWPDGRRPDLEVPLRDEEDQTVWCRHGDCDGEVIVMMVPATPRWHWDGCDRGHLQWTSVGGAPDDPELCFGCFGAAASDDLGYANGIDYPGGYCSQACRERGAPARRLRQLYAALNRGVDRPPRRYVRDLVEFLRDPRAGRGSVHEPGIAEGDGSW